MAINSELAKAGVVATLALASVLASSSVAQQADTDNPPPGDTVLQSAQAPGPAGERLGDAEPVETKASLPRTPSAKPRKKIAKYDISMIGNRQVGRGLNIYSIEREQRMGKQLASELETHVKLVADPLVNDYVNGLVQRLVRSSDAKVPFTARVIDNAEVNAFALPGGFLYVQTGLIQAAENEAELAAVIAHEIAHVAARHATKQASRAFLVNIASIPAVFVGGSAGVAVRQVFGLTVFKFSRDAEREADLLGIEYGYIAGYDPVALIQIFERLRVAEPEKSSRLGRAFMCHPTTDDRIKRAQEAIITYLPSRDTYVVNTSAFDEMKGHLAQLGLDGAAGMGSPVLRRRRPTPTSQEEAPAN